jgi:monoamine oxidase
MIAAFAQDLLQEYEARLTVLRARVVSIDDTGQQKVALTMADQSTRQFDYCIVTIPPAEVLKLAFAPDLSQPRKEACRLLRLGSYKKVAFRPRRFPPGNVQKPVEERDSIELDYEYYIYDAENDGVWQYFRLPTEPGILICVTAGDLARRLDGQADEEVTIMIRDLLSDAYPAGDFRPNDDGVVVTNWTNQPYVYGAYSYTRYDQHYPADDPFPLSARRRIAEPHGRVHFAGEASWPNAYGTIHGAYFTGIRAVNGVIKAIRDG